MAKTLLIVLTVATVAAFLIFSAEGEKTRRSRWTRESNKNCTEERRQSRKPIVKPGNNSTKTCWCSRRANETEIMYCRNKPRRSSTTTLQPSSTTQGAPTTSGAPSSSEQPASSTGAPDQPTSSAPVSTDAAETTTESGEPEP